MMPVGFPLGRKVTVASKISYLMKGLSDRSIFIVGRYDVSMTSNIL